ncbi:DedA family protein [Actinoplanes sp. NBC_00393]|uniref:DedA family protein n=1 Tax=Actinoplanes sp. NBC_00393 TaxID=2975953 RepID=UPI002E227922
MGWLNDLLGGLPPALVYLVVAVLVTAETALIAGLVLPAATALVAMGLLANAGVVPLVPALAVAVFSALLGGNLAYLSGSRRAVAVTNSRWQRAERLFARHGGRAIFLGQWVVGARTLMPRLAARSGVPRGRFLAWHTPAAMLWSLWMVGASYLAGASYDILAARAGRAAGALAALTLILLGLILAGRWFGQHPDPVRAFARSLSWPANPWPPRLWHPVAAAGLSLGLLTSLAVLLVAAIPAVVRFSGLAATDQAVAEWARSQWTSDGYLFALETATTLVPEVLIALAVAVSLIRWWWPRTSLFLRSPAGLTSPSLRSAAGLAGLGARGGWAGLRRGGGSGLLEALGPVLPAAILAAVLAMAVPPGWQAAETLVFPTPAEFDGNVPLDAAALALATMSAGQTAQVAAAAGLLAWLVARGLPWSWQVAVWTLAAVGTVLCAGSWVYLGWSRMSETVAALVLGAAWAAVNAAVWSGRAGRPRPVPPPADDSPEPAQLALTAATP